jgi:hypothetical protein
MKYRGELALLINDVNQFTFFHLDHSHCLLFMQCILIWMISGLSLHPLKLLIWEMAAASVIMVLYLQAKCGGPTDDGFLRSTQSRYLDVVQQG